MTNAPAGTLVVPGREGARAAAVPPAMRTYLHGRVRTGGCRPSRWTARHHPDARVDVDRIYVRDGDTWASAGIIAGIDLALAMVESDLGADVAAATLGAGGLPAILLIAC